MPVTATGAEPPAPGMPGGGGGSAARRRPAHAALVLARPRQWIKNLLVVAAAGAAGALGHDDVPGRVALAAAAFCLLSAGIYAFNDVRDAAEDGLHPRKCRRPVAAGELDAGVAVGLGIALAATGIAVCLALRPLLALVAVGYLALTLSYTWVWRRVVVFDIVAIAGGFVLRALAGGVAAPVTLSRWFVLVVCCAALFVAAGKRHAELVRTGGRALRERRRVLARYTPRVLRLLLFAAGAGALLAYYMWVWQPLGLRAVPWRTLTAIPFTIGMLRYGALVRAGGGETPEELVLGDRVLAAAGVAWIALFELSVQAVGS